MRRLAGRLSLWVGLLLLLLPRSSAALFHFAVIDEIMTSHFSDPNVQFVEIRMLAPGQNLVTNSVLAAFDTTGTYIGDVLIVPADVVNQGSDVRWIMGTSQFQTVSGLTPDFLIPAGLPTGGGMVCWGAPGILPPVDTSWDRTNFTFNYVDCVAYGTYSGPSNVHVGAPTPLDADGHSLVRISNTNNNANDFECAAQATPKNNAGVTAIIDANPSCLVCGNDVLEAGEECDDGNTNDGDGCSAGCLIEGPGVPAVPGPALILFVALLLGTSIWMIQRTLRLRT